MRRLLKSVFWLVLAGLGFVGFTYSSLPDVTILKNNDPKATAFIEYRRQEANQRGKKIKIQQSWISLNKISKLFRRTVVVSEDASFWKHQGIDWFEVKEVLKKSWLKKRLVRGASTISQQTAKNLYLNPDKNLYRKFKEYLIAKELEKHLSKRRILEIYLNCVELGKGIFGVKSAAAYYFGKHPSNLTPFEMIRLAAIVPRPLFLHPNKPSRGLKWRCEAILSRLIRYDFLNEEDASQVEDQMILFFDD